MRICVVAPYNVLSNDAGAPVRAEGLSNALCSAGARVVVLHHGPSKDLGRSLQFVGFRVPRPLLGSEKYLRPLNPFFPWWLSKLLAGLDFDILQCEQPWALIPTIVYARKSRIPLVLDEHNVEFLWSLHASRMPVLSPYVYLMERFAISNSELILAVSEVDKKELMKMYGIPEGKISLVPTGVTISRFHLAGDKGAMKEKLGLRGKVALFHGSMDAKQNIESAELIARRVSPNVREADFLIIGKHPPESLKALASASRNLRIMGYVPNVEDYIMASDVCLAPVLSGSGTRLKLLDYMAAGKPIVATYKAVEGLPIENGTDALLFKEVEEDFVNAIRLLLSNDEYGTRIGSNARLKAARFDWGTIGRNLLDRYATLLSEVRR
jgi:glycosyltransferase involved in cell wall biosynthesis